MVAVRFSSLGQGDAVSECVASLSDLVHTHTQAVSQFVCPGVLVLRVKRMWRLILSEFCAGVGAFTGHSEYFLVNLLSIR